jgi:CubicO group peptidase (beta-lactamase class C family)
MAQKDVKGMAIAVIDNGAIGHMAAYGHRNVERGLPLTTDTVMYGASLTKTAFAYMVLQLVDEGRLDLDRSIAEYLPRPLPDHEEYADPEPRVGDTPSNARTSRARRDWWLARLDT